MSAALGIAPADDNKFFPVEAFDFEPRAPIRLIPAIGALRYNALDTVFAGYPVELRAASDLVIVVSQAIRRTFQQGFQRGLAVHQRQSHQILAVQEQ
jgi:hypothetical protein